MLILFKEKFMKKNIIFLPLFFFVINITFSQNTPSTVLQMDEAVKILARDIHAKLAEKRAQKFSVGQFTYQNGITPFGAYWVNQLIGEITNIPGRNYTVHSGETPDAQWTITGEAVIIAGTVRIYSRLIRLSDRSIEAGFNSDFQLNEQINSMLVSAGSSSSVGWDAYEQDSWQSPVSYTIGSTQGSAVVMNRTLTEGDEDFFLLVPATDGRLTIETTGSIDTYMHLYNYETEAELSSDDDGGSSNNARIIYNVRAGTRYLAVVRGYSNSVTGSYGFRGYIFFREGATSWENPVSVEIGNTEDAAGIQREIQADDEEYFLLVPDRSGRLTIETTGRIDTYMELFNADTRDLLDENDDGGNSNNARIRYNVRAGERYIVMVRGYSSSVRGNYSFRAFFPNTGSAASDAFEPDDDPAQAKTIEIGSPQSRTFHSGDDVDWVQFRVERQGRFSIQASGVNSNRLDTYIELYDNNMNLIAEDDDSGESLSARLSINLSAGSYYLKVWCLNDEPDQGYILKIDAQ
jgi:hypothetical protein